MLAPQKGGVPVLTRTGKEHRHQIRKILEAPDHALPLPPRHSASATPSLRGSAPPFHAPSRRSTAFTFDPSSAGVTMWPSAVNRSRMASRSEEHTSELQSLMRISYAVFCLKKKKQR